MTLKSITDKLTAEGATDINYVLPDGKEKGTAYNPFGQPDVWILRIFYTPPRVQGSNVARKTQKMELKKIGEDDYEYYESVPSLLRESPTPTPQRPFTYTDAQIKTFFEAPYTAPDSGDPENPTVWEVQRVTQQRDGDFDKVTVQILENDSTIIYRERIAWTDSQGVKQHRPVQ